MSEMHSATANSAPALRLSEREIWSSLRALQDFVVYHAVELDDEGKGGLTVSVTYRSPYGTITLPTRLTLCIKGERIGDVHLKQCSMMPADWYLLHFSPVCARYTFKRSEARLTIRGVSPWMDGYYIVWIESLPRVSQRGRI